MYLQPLELDEVDKVSPRAYRKRRSRFGCPVRFKQMLERGVHVTSSEDVLRTNYTE